MEKNFKDAIQERKIRVIFLPADSSIATPVHNNLNGSVRHGFFILLKILTRAKASTGWGSSCLWFTGTFVWLTYSWCSNSGISCSGKLWRESFKRSSVLREGCWWRETILKRYNIEYSMYPWWYCNKYFERHSYICRWSTSTIERSEGYYLTPETASRGPDAAAEEDRCSKPRFTRADHNWDNGNGHSAAACRWCAGTDRCSLVFVEFSLGLLLLLMVPLQNLLLAWK